MGRRRCRHTSSRSARQAHGDASGGQGFLDWASIEPFVGHVPTSRLLMPLRRLRRLHPAQIADLVEAASHDEGEEIISAVHGDPELEADVFEELNTEHQVEFLRDKSDAEAAAVLAEMGPDDAADLVTELDQPRRAPILLAAPAVAAGEGASTAQLRAEQRRRSDEHGLRVGCARRDGRRGTCGGARGRRAAAGVRGCVPARGRHARWGRCRSSTCCAPRPACGSPSWSSTPMHPSTSMTISRKLRVAWPTSTSPSSRWLRMTTRVIGVITVDDVLEAMLPNSWRRRAEADARLTPNLRRRARVVHSKDGNHALGVYQRNHGRRRQSPVPATSGHARATVITQS